MSRTIVIVRNSWSMTTVVIGHQGGWDELLLIAVPIVVVVGLLAVVKRRVSRPVRDESLVDSVDHRTDAS